MKTTKVFAKEVSQTLIENKMESPMLLDILNKFILSSDDESYMVGFGENEMGNPVLFVEFSQITVIFEDADDLLVVSLSLLIDKEVVEVMSVDMTKALHGGDWSIITQSMSSYLKIIFGLDSVTDLQPFDCVSIHEYIINGLTD